MGNARRRAPRGDQLRGLERAERRHARHGHLISETLDALVRDELSDPSLEDVALTTIELSPDGQHLWAWFLAPSPAVAEAALARAEGYLRVRVTECLGLKRVPNLHFAADPRGKGATWPE
jgi:ribosome-binding factor A